MSKKVVSLILTLCMIAGALSSVPATAIDSGIGQVFNFGVSWDSATSTITLDTGRGYTPE